MLLNTHRDSRVCAAKHHKSHFVTNLNTTCCTAISIIVLIVPGDGRHQQPSCIMYSSVNILPNDTAAQRVLDATNGTATTDMAPSCNESTVLAMPLYAPHLYSVQRSRSRRGLDTTKVALYIAQAFSLSCNKAAFPSSRPLVGSTAIGEQTQNKNAPDTTVICT